MTISMDYDDLEKIKNRGNESVKCYKQGYDEGYKEGYKKGYEAGMDGYNRDKKSMEPQGNPFIPFYSEEPDVEEPDYEDGELVCGGYTI